MAIADVVALLIVALVVIGLLPLMEQVRRSGRIGEDLSHMRTIAAGAGSYAADFEDRCFNFSWKANISYPGPWPDLVGPFPNDNSAASAQLTYIVRSRGGRTMPETPLIYNFVPHMAYQGVVLADYLDLPVPQRMFNSSAGHRWRWCDDPKGYDQGLYTPHYGIGGSNWRHPYGSDLRLGAAFFDDSPVGSRMYPATWSSYYIPGGAIFRPRPLTLVAHPSQKALTHSVISWHFKPAYHMDPQARSPVLFVDGSAGVRPFADANPGANPNSGSPMTITYNPSSFGPDPYPPGGSAFYPAGPYWTRARLEGRDFGGPEVAP